MAQAALAEPRERACFVNGLRAKSWVVYAKQPFAGPAQVLDYLGRYTHSVAIANHRQSSSDERDRYPRALSLQGLRPR